MTTEIASAAEGCRRPGVVERAFQLAQSGLHQDVVSIGRALDLEGYELVSAHLMAPTLRRELLALCRTAHTTPSQD